MKRVRFGFLSALVVLAAWTAIDLSAADEWIEVKSTNFTVLSNAGDRATRKMVWQLEQVRSAMAGLWSWAKVDLNKPMTVIAVKDESSMRTIAPQYWEVRGGTRPASVWVSGPDEHYLAVRTDVEVDNAGTINPHINAYFSYIGLVMGQSLSRDLPAWFSRGFTGVLSNTIVRDDHLLLGAPIPWQLQRLQERSPMPLAKLVTITYRSPELAKSEDLQSFDAQTWAFVHFLMFGDEGARSEKLNQFARLVSGGTDAASAFKETLGPIDALELPFRVYIERRIYSYRRVNIDVKVARERFPVRPVPPGESAASRALFHAAMRRPVEANALIAEARKTDPNLAASYAAEGMLLDAAKKPDEAKVAFAAAVERGSTSPYVHYRLASLTWRANPDRETLAEVEKQLTKAIALNVRYAAAYSWLGEIRTSLDPKTDSLGLVRRAISIEPNEAGHRIRAARVLLRQGKPEDAKTDAQVALTLADSDQERQEAQRLLEVIQAAPKR